jgi:hypothetical protein
MKKIKTIMAVVMAVVMMLGVSSCSLGKSDKEQAQESVEMMLSMLKQYKLDNLEDYVARWSDDDIDISSGTGIQKSVADKMLKAVFKNLKYKVTDVTQEDSDTIYVTAEVRNVDMGPVLKNWMAYIQSLRLEHNDYNQTRLLKESAGRFVELVDEAADDDSYVESSVRFKVVKSRWKWKVSKISSDDLDALMGGFTSSLSES